MLYINQNDYSHVPYQHNMANGGAPEGRRNVGTSGCGLCCSCMVVEHLTAHTLSVEECVRLSEDNAANLNPGTSLKVLGPILAEKFGLEVSKSRDVDEMLACLHSGGEVIVNVGSQGEGCKALFTSGKHYMLILAVDGDEVCLLDPGYRPASNYLKEELKHLVRRDDPLLYCSLDTLMCEVVDCEFYFYMFKRKKG